MVNLPKFVIHLDRLNNDISKVALLIEKFEQDRRRSGYRVVGKNLPLQAQFLRAFPADLFAIIESEALTQGDDTFGNVYRGIRGYTHIEIAFDPSYQIISAIRLLNESKQKNKDRYTIFSVINPLDPTTVNIASDIRALSDQTNEFFGVDGASRALQCGPDTDVLDGVINRAGSVVGVDGVEVFPSNGITSNLTWSDFVNEYFYPTPKIIASEQPLTPDSVRELSERFDLHSVKTPEELERENRELASARFKLNLSKTRSGGYELNNAGSYVLENTEKLKSEIEGAIGDPVAVLNACYQEIFDKFSLGCLIKSAAECIIPPLTCKEILRGLRVDTIQERLELVFPNQPRVVDLVNQEIQKLREENPTGEVTTDALLDAIEIFIDLEALCDAINFSTVGFGIPTIELPDLPIVDLFASITIEIENAILEALLEAIKNMILGILDDLASCDTLDAFVAGALQGQFGPDAGIAGDLVTLFTDPGTLTDPNRGAIASSLGRRWDEFSQDADLILGDAVRLGLTGSASLVGGAAEIRNELEAIGGIQGLARGLETGELSQLTGSVLLQNMLEAELDVTELLNYSGPGSEALNSLISEIGRFELSDDGNTFTLRRISDDQVVTIIRAASVAPPVRLDISTEGLTDLMEKSLDDVVSILSPGETLELFAGKPSERVSRLVREIVNVRYPAIATAGDPVSLFVALGEATGLNQLRDAVILLAQRDDRRNVPRKFCPEDDERIRLREDILVRGGLEPDQVAAEIDRIVDIRKDRFNELIDLLGSDFTPEEVIENIKCGTGVQPDGKRPPVIEDQLDSTINIMFEPAKMSFDREIAKYVDAISTYKKKQKTIERTVTADNNTPVFGGTGDNGSIFQSFSGLKNENNESLFQDNFSKEVINPEFRKLVNDGFIPIREGETEPDGTEGDPKGPYTGGSGEPISVDDFTRDTGGLFKNGIKINHNNITIKEEDNFMSLSLRGSLQSSDPVSDYSPYKTKKPKWVLSYAEEDDEYTLKVRSVGDIPSALYGRVPFYEDYKYSRVIRDDMDPALLERLQEFNIPDTSKITRKDSFSYVFLDKLRNVLEIETLSQEELIRNALTEQYDDFVKDFIFDAGRSFSKNRLLKKVPNKDLKNIGPNVNVAAQNEQSNLIVLNLINFSPTPTDEQRRCKISPHLLDLEFIKKIVKESFDKECEDPTDPNDGLTPSRKPINAAGFVGAVLTTIRLYVIEQVFRSLFIFDEFGYSLDLAEDPLLIDYMSFRMREDIERLGFWDKFEAELRVAYDKMVARGHFDVEDLPVEDDGSSGQINIQGTSPQSPYDGPARTSFVRGIPEHLKVLTRETLKAVLSKMSEIVGKSDDAGIDFNRSFLNSLKTYNTFSELNDQRFIGDNTTRGRFILERYMRIPTSTDDTVAAQQSDYYKNVVAINDWEEFLEENPEFSGRKIEDLKIEDLFEENWKFGMRLVYLSPEIGDGEVEESELQSSPYFKKMDLGGPKQLNTDTVQQEKSFYVTDRVLNTAPPGSEDFGVKTYKQFNSVVIAQEELDIQQFVMMNDASKNLDEIFEQQYKGRLLSSLSQNTDYRMLMEHSLFTNRLTSLMAIYSSYALNSEDVKFLLEGTKLQMRRLFETLENIGDYTFRTDLAAAENAAEYQAQFNRIGNPAGPSGPDALYLAAITPILIMKGIVELSDPNIFLASKIITAAAAGYLSPKFERVGDFPEYQNQDGRRGIKVEGSDDRVIVGVPSDALVTDAIFTKDPDTGQLLVKAEAVLQGVGINENGEQETSYTIRPDLAENTPGDPIIAYTKVMEVETEEVVPGTGIRRAVLNENGLPIPKTNDQGEPIIKSGPGVYGVRYGMGEKSLSERAGEAAQSIPAIQFAQQVLEDFGAGERESEFDIVESEPVFPGEPINLPYNVVSPALLPINVFGLFVPWMFCGPPINPGFGALQFLPLEPLLWQLPHHQQVAAKSSVSRDVKKEYNIDLSGFESVKCEDEEEPEE